MIGQFRRVAALFDRGTKARFLAAVAGSVVVALLEVVAVLLVLPLMALITGASSEALDRVRDLLGGPDDTELAIYLAVLLFAGFLVKGVVGLVIRWWTLGFVNRQSVRTSTELMRYYLYAPMGLHVRRGSAELLRTMNDAVGAVYSQTVVGGVGALTEAITIVAMAVTLLITAPLPALGLAAYFGVAGFLLQQITKRRSMEAGKDLIHAAYETNRTAFQALGGIKEIKLRNEQELFVGRYGEARLQTALALRRTAFITDLPKYVMEILFIVGIGFTTAVLFAVNPTSSALGLLTLFAAAGFRVMPSTVRMLASLSVMRAGSASLDLVEADVHAARQLGNEQRHSRAGGEVTLDDSLSVEGVYFRYPDSDEDVLHDIGLSVPAGTSLALVGSSGAGKSTLVDVVLGLQSPQRGRILADGRDVSTRLPAWQDLLAMVPQDVYLLDGTLRENIVFSPDREGSDTDIDEAVRDACLDDLVDSTSEGLELDVGERGARLSGGQRQRVGIARALYRRPRLLVLDEATSALDNKTEREITRTLERLRGRTTTIVVAHRLSTVRECDQIVYLEAGRVLGIGDFDSLQTSCPPFAELVSLGSLEPRPALRDS